MMAGFTPVFLLLVFYVWCVAGSKVLFISSPAGGSHTNHMSKLADILADNSDHLVYFLRNDVNVAAKSSAKVKVIVVEDEEGGKALDEIMGGKQHVSADNARFGHWNMSIGVEHFSELRYLFGKVCHGMLQRKDVWESLGKEEMDLVVIEEFPSCLFLAAAHYIKAPRVHYSTSNIIAGSAYILGIPTIPSYTELLLNPTGADMSNPTFINRAKNLVNYLTETYGFYYQTMHSPSIDIAREYLGDQTPDLWEVVRDTSFIMAHSDLAFHKPKPLLPNMALIGGIMCTDAKPLDKELSKVVAASESNKGIIYVAFGTYVGVKMMGEAMADFLLDTFQELPEYTFLWKLDTVPSWRQIPSHVKIRKWMPQQDILGHNRTKVFISHGGLNSMYEAMFHAVPVLVLPIFGDQEANADSMVSTGMGKTLPKNNLHKEDMVSALRELVEERYQEAARRTRAIFRDHPQTPRERFLFWINYLLRHKGAPHLRIDTHSLNLFQYYNLDLFLTLLTLPLIILCLVTRKCRRVKKPKDVTAKSKKTN